MKAWKVVFTLASMMSASGAHAAVNDGNELLDQCQAVIKFHEDTNNDHDQYGQGKCMGVVSAVMDMAAIRKAQLPLTSQLCLPFGGISNGQAVRVVVKYLQENPALLNLKGTLLTAIALGQAYPCQ